MNLKHDPPHWSGGVRTQVGNEHENQRRQAIRHSEGRKRIVKPPEEPITPETIAKRLYHIWNVADVERWFEWAKDRGARIHLDRIMFKELETMDLVPAEPFRVRYENSPLRDELRKDICFELDRLERQDQVAQNTYGSRSLGDIQLLGRTLGTQLQSSSNTVPIVRVFIPYKLAEACCKAMGLRPVDCGI